MASTYPVRSFAYGEISALARSRVDSPFYSGGCKSLINMFGLSLGPAEKRPGTYYAGKGKTLGKKVWLHSWRVSADVGYVMEWGENYIRFFKAGAPLMNGGSAVEVTTTYTEAELPDVRVRQVTDAMYITHPAHKPATLTYATDVSWTLADMSITAGVGEETFATTGHYPSHLEFYEDRLIFARLDTNINTFWGSRVADYDNFMLRTSGVVTTPIATPGVVNWTAHGLVANSSVVFEVSGGALPTGLLPGVVYYVQESGLTPNSFKVSATAGGADINFTGATTGTQSGYASPALATDAWQKRPQVQKRNQILWLLAEDALLFGTSEGPFRVGGKEQILTGDQAWWPRRQASNGSSSVQPLMIDDFAAFVSKSGKKIYRFEYSQDSDKYIADDITLLAPHVTGSGVVGMVNQKEPDSILWAWTADGQLIAANYSSAAKTLAWSRMDVGGLVECAAVIPTDGEDQVWISVVRTIEGVDYRYIEYLAPRAWELMRDYHGVDSGILWDGGDPVDVTSVSVVEYPIWDASTTYNTGDVVLLPGMLECYTSQTDGNIGHFPPPDAVNWLADPYPALVCSSCTAPAHGFDNDDLVRFSDVAGADEVNGEVYTVKNKATDTFDLYTRDGSSPVYLSGPTAGSGGTVELVTNTLSGLDHLEGETVRVCGDASVMPDEVVASGEVTLEEYANKIHSGLAFTAVLEPLDIAEAKNKKKRVVKVFAEFYRTGDAQVGPSASKMKELTFDGLPTMDEEPEDQTVGVRELFEGRADYQGTVRIESYNPLPLTVNALMYDVVLETK